jgi:hypothetical protein
MGTPYLILSEFAISDAGNCRINAIHTFILYYNPPKNARGFKKLFPLIE